MKVRYDALKKPKSHVNSDGSFCRDILGGLDLVLLFSREAFGYTRDLLLYIDLSCHAIHRRRYWRVSETHSFDKEAERVRGRTSCMSNSCGLVSTYEL